MKRNCCLLLILVFMFLLSSPISSFASWMKLTPDSLDQSAEIILVGHIEGATGKYHFADDIWDTEWKVNVRYYLKGNRPDKNLTVHTPGVKDGNTRRSTDYSLDGRGNMVLLFLAKQDNRYFPLTPQGIIGLQSNRYTKGVLDPPTGVTVLKEYSIRNGQLSMEEKEQMEEIIRNKTIFDPDKAMEGFPREQTGVPQNPVSSTKNFAVDKLMYQSINIFILVLILAFGCWTFLDSRRRGLSYFSSLIWSLIVIFIIPPIGILIYLFYRRKRWL